ARTLLRRDACDLRHLSRNESFERAFERHCEDAEPAWVALPALERRRELGRRLALAISRDDAPGKSRCGDGQKGDRRHLDGAVRAAPGGARNGTAYDRLAIRERHHRTDDDPGLLETRRSAV